jgi:hypothetical protein
MTTCNSCGQQIEIRYVGGRLAPIHTNGGWCPNSSGSSHKLAARRFQTIGSYTNPNAVCPVCGDIVFFYQNHNGGRVFFDALGWPWPKHPCTDTAAAQRGKVGTPPIKRGSTSSLRDKNNVVLELYKLRGIDPVEDGWVVSLTKILDAGFFMVSLTEQQMDSEGLTLDDWRDAPSFVVAPTVRGAPTRVLHFICARLKKIVTIKLPKASA